MIEILFIVWTAWPGDFATVVGGKCTSGQQCRDAGAQYCALKGSVKSMVVYSVSNLDGKGECTVRCLNGWQGTVKCQEPQPSPSPTPTLN